MARKKKRRTSTVSSRNGPTPVQEPAPSWKKRKPSPPPPVRRSPRPSLNPQEIAEAVWNFLDLVIRVATAHDRGLDQVDRAERKWLTEMMKELAGRRDALPGSSPGKKHKVLTHSQQSLGNLRRDLDAICEFALEFSATPERDKILFAVITETCARDPLLREVGSAGVNAAIGRVRARGQARIRSEPELAADWLKALGERPSATFTAGEILAEIARGYPGQKLAASRSSTAKYVAQIREVGENKLFARSVVSGERLTYLATAFGVPAKSAAVVAFRMSRLICEHRPDRDNSGSTRYRYPTPFARGIAKPYRLRSRASWDKMVKAIERELEEVPGFPEMNVESVADVVLHEFYPPIEWDGLDIHSISPKTKWEAARRRLALTSG
jgi:hypothetical protein